MLFNKQIESQSKRTNNMNDNKKNLGHMIHGDEIDSTTKQTLKFVKNSIISSTNDDDDDDDEQNLFKIQQNDVSTVLITTISPPIISKETMTAATKQYSPVWKSLIYNKIVNSNKNDFDGSNAVESVIKTPPFSNNRETFYTFPPKITTTSRTMTTILSNFQQHQANGKKWQYFIDSQNTKCIFVYFLVASDDKAIATKPDSVDKSNESKMNEYEYHKHKQEVLVEQTPIAKLNIAFRTKPLVWSYMDPAIVYRKMTSPVKTFYKFQFV